MRRLAAAKLVAEASRHTIDGTALIHEGYLRLVGDQHFDGRGHFFAAAEAMRRVLVDRVRGKARHNRGDPTAVTNRVTASGAAHNGTLTTTPEGSTTSAIGSETTRTGTNPEDGDCPLPPARR